MENYTFENFWKDLNDGFQIYYDYLGDRYLIYKMSKNCYKNEIINAKPKSSKPRMAIWTLRRVKEVFPFMENLEYKSGI